MVSAQEALQRLHEGNSRFVSNVPSINHHNSAQRRHELESGQEPIAIILGCSDSRVPAELIFDQGLGDLFVIRVAGNIVAPSQIGSVEFAAEMTGARLVVVLGHSQCGAILATLDQLERPKEHRSRNLHAIVDRIAPSVEPLMLAKQTYKREELVQQCVRANIRASMHQLQSGSKIVDHLVLEDGLLIVGAEYSLETGLVDFFTGQEADPR